MAQIKIQCEATTRTSIKLGKPRRCKAKGYFTPTTRRMLCVFMGVIKQSIVRQESIKVYTRTIILL